jgi:predicted enzyme related to lactoylglutathione lyase
VKTLRLSLIVACGVLALAPSARAQVVINSARLGAVDSPALAKFYSSAFGMQETNRLPLPAGPEIFLNFGATVEAAKANKSTPLVIMHRDSDALQDPVPHLILNVTDMAAIVASVKAAGGSFDSEPKPFGNPNGPMIGIAKDPAGNLIELIQRRQQQ